MEKRKILPQEESRGWASVQRCSEKGKKGEEPNGGNLEGKRSAMFVLPPDGRSGTVQKKHREPFRGEREGKTIRQSAHTRRGESYSAANLIKKKTA